jgi:hypothetical protein
MTYNDTDHCYKINTAQYEYFGILEVGAGETARSGDLRWESIDPFAGPQLRALLVVFSSPSFLCFRT